MKTKTKDEEKKQSCERGANTPLNPKEWQIEWCDPNELTPYSKNARKNDDTVPYLMNSIKRFGFKIPLVIDKNGIVVCGHTRLKAALNLGFTKVPCVRATDLTDAEIKAFRLADNKIQELSGWDFAMLSEQLGELKLDFDEDMCDFGFLQGGKVDIDDFFKDDEAGENAGKPKVIHCVCPECGKEWDQEV